MKILIVCDMFPPAFAPRMGYLCKYMQREGWQPVVVTEYINEHMFAFLANDIPVTYINYYKAKGRISRKIEWLSVFLLDFFFNYKDRKLVKVASRLLKHGNFKGILCSTYRTFPLPAARKLADKFHLPFIADTRDIIEQYASHEYISQPFHTFPWLDELIIKLFRRKLLKGRNRALRDADFITTVSPWHVEVMKRYNSQVELIYNGYDPEIFYPNQIETSTFRITYTGRMVSLATRDPRLLFEAIHLLYKDNKISPDKFRVQWYMDKVSCDMIKPLVEEYNISAFMDYCGNVSADEIPDIINSSSVLLQLTNKFGETGSKGFMTTKLFEAFAVEKPVLCVRSDESYLEETICKTNTGISARTVDEVYTFILNCYNEWKEKGFTTINSNKEIIESFSRKKQAEQFMHIFTVLTERKK